MKKAPLITLSNGEKMPAFGLGTFLIRGGEGITVIKTAIDIGYRHFDTAYLYTNEHELGEAVRDKIEDKTITRSEVFVVTKLWNIFHGKDMVEDGCRKSLLNLGLDYIDLYLMHFPVSFTYQGDDIPWPKNRDETPALNNLDYLETWKAMEKLVHLGLVKSIGLSNFNSEQVERVIQGSEIKPVVNQIECSPYINQKKLIAFCKERDVAIVAYSPLIASKEKCEPQIDKIATKYKKKKEQIILRYLVQLGTAPIPKTITTERLNENIDVFEFTLTKEEMDVMDSLNTGQRVIKFSSGVQGKYYPFNLEF